MNISIALINASLTQLDNVKWASVGQIVVGFCGIFTNSLVMWTIWRQKSLHNSCFILIGQLAFADWIVGVSFFATGIKRLIRMYCRMPEVQSQVKCCFEMFFPYFGQSASLCLALAIGIERFVAVAFPLQFGKHERTIGKAIAPVAWSYAIIDSGFMFYGTSTKMIVTACTILTAVTQDFNSFQAVHKTVIVVAIMATYGLVLLAMTMQLKKAKKQNRQDIIAIKKSQQIKTAQMLAVVAVVYLFLQMMTRIAQALLVFLSVECQSSIAPYIRMLMIINSDVHFFIYFGMSTEFRDSFKRWFGCQTTNIAPEQAARQLPENQRMGTERTTGSLQVRNSTITRHAQ